jgi:hypothetical protein
MKWKKIGLIVLALFLIYFVVIAPVESAEALKTVGGWISRSARDAATSLATFLRTLF